MSDSVFDLDLSVPTGREYFNSEREWREEFVYFLLVDRFDDATVRVASGGAGRASGSGTAAQLGGRIRATMNPDGSLESFEVLGPESREV